MFISQSNKVLQKGIEYIKFIFTVWNFKDNLIKQPSFLLRWLYILLDLRIGQYDF